MTTSVARKPLVQDRMQVLGDIPRIWAEIQPDARAFRFEGRDTSYAAFDAVVDRVANGLAAAGIEPGMRIAYLGKNSDQYFEILFGAARLGAVMIAINWRLAEAEIAFILEDSAAALLFTGPEFADAGARLAALAAIRSWFVTEGQGDAGHDYAAWRDSQSAAPFAANVKPDDIAVQMYTSGTTGHPKGAMLSHRALLAMRRRLIESDAEWARWTPDDVGLLITPIGHIAGTGWGVMSLFFGAASVIVRAFEPDQLFDYIEGDHISKLFLVPSAMLIVLRHPRARKTDYSRLKCILYGASPIPKALLEEGMEVFSCGFAQQYGLTETCGTVVVLTPEDHMIDGGAKLRAAGRPLPDVELRIVDERGRDLPAGQIGEIVIRAPAILEGYWNRPEATAEAIEAGGWFHSGDAGYIDEDGFLFIHDRVKDMIVSGGENVYPAEVENAIYGHPAVDEVAVIGVPDAKWGEAVTAVIVTRPGATVDSAELIAWTKTRIAGFKAPKSIEVVEALPRNASGKVLRRELRARYAAREPAA